MAIYRIMTSALNSLNSFPCLTLSTVTSVCIFSIMFSIHFLGSYKENLCNNQEFLQLAIISLIFVFFFYYYYSGGHKVKGKLDVGLSQGLKGLISTKNFSGAILSKTFSQQLRYSASIFPLLKMATLWLMIFSSAFSQLHYIDRRFSVTSEKIASNTSKSRLI